MASPGFLALRLQAKVGNRRRCFLARGGGGPMNTGNVRQALDHVCGRGECRSASEYKRPTRQRSILRKPRSMMRHAIALHSVWVFADQDLRKTSTSLAPSQISTWTGGGGVGIGKIGPGEGDQLLIQHKDVSFFRRAIFSRRMLSGFRIKKCHLQRLGSWPPGVTGTFMEEKEN